MAETDEQPKVVVGGEQAPAEPTSQPDTQPNTEQPEFSPDYDAPIDPTSNQAVTWTASEFIAHDKAAGWYIALATITLVAAVLAYLITHDAVTPGVIIVAGTMLGIYGSHKPRQLEYKLDLHGITIGSKHYDYHEFRCFSVMPEGAFSSIIFMPLKRFAPPLSIYYGPEDEEHILTVLSNYLPFEELRRDAVDILMRRIRF